MFGAKGWTKAAGEGGGGLRTYTIYHMLAICSSSINFSCDHYSLKVWQTHVEPFLEGIHVPRVEQLVGGRESGYRRRPPAAG